MNFKILSLLAIVAALIACQAPVGSSKETTTGPLSSGIVFGQNVKDSDSLKNYIVAIVNPKLQSICTGTLIERNVVLTAAHCFEDSTNPRDYLVVFGLEIDPDKAIQESPVTELRIHPLYDGDSKDLMSGNDIALVKLKRNAPSEYQPAVITGRYHVFLKNSVNYVTSGYGITGADEDDAGVLRKVILSAKNLSLAAQARGKLIELNAKAGGPCIGDSGGPLFEQMKDAQGNTFYSVVGIVSQTIRTKISSVSKTPFCEGQSYYTNVPYYKAWIESSVRDL